MMLALACSAAAATHTDTGIDPSRARARSATDASFRTVRIALADVEHQVRISSTGAWEIFAEDGRTPVALTQAGEQWTVEREGRVLRAMRADARPVSAREAVLVVRPLDADGSIAFNGKHWRGELVVAATNDGIQVVNRLPMDEYLKGVVPLEIGATQMTDLAAAEAQAVAARSYAVTHLAGSSKAFDMRATILDQVYGGVDAETRLGNSAVEGTAGFVLLYAGQPVNAPYHATCGGSTAEPQDVWRTGSEPYLRRVSDQIPGTNRFYCDAAPRYRWTRTIGREELRQSIVRYLRSINASAANLTSIGGIAVTDVTPAGRVATLTIDTDRGPVVLRGNEMRYGLRSQSGDLLYSTYFSLDATVQRGNVESVVLHGGGNGHGVGMCQAGAIGRAREGQSFRTILQAYYPGTSVGTL